MNPPPQTSYHALRGFMDIYIPGIHFVGPGFDFGRFWGPGWEAKFMKNALEEVTAKNAEKKSIGCAGSASCAGPAGR